MLTAFMAAPLAISGDWITIAGPAKNTGGRTYPPEALCAIAKGARGQFIYSWPVEWPAEGDQRGDMARLLGRVSGVRMEGLLVQIKVDWAQWVERPAGSFICPWGEGILDGLSGHIHDYLFKSLQVTPSGSTFVEATAI